MSYSYSRVDCHNQCAFKYKLRYIDKLEPLPDLRPENALFIGSAGHLGIEKRSVEEAINSYKSNYPEITDVHEMEIYKIKKMVEKANSQIPEGEYEYKLLHDDGFIGYIDELVKVDEGVYDLYDFKFSLDAGKYKHSPQVHIYKYFYEKLTGNKIRDMYYAVVPKVKEMLTESMTKDKLVVKIDETYATKDVQFVKIEYDPQQVNFFFARKALMDRSDKSGVYERRHTTLCKWCEYHSYCTSNGKDLSELTEESKLKLLKEIDLFNGESNT